ncbi:hypothetical protein AYI69_g1728 [Smittium culicis]|uniref:CCHC-type domain-containing protein n=1 Tax=Smittium culicis TaxID=133412 RepID=A0A1R1YPH9_9FUNG|nr:hypothetical protein AYI69_g1728 [Smittium culicis]
MTTSFEVFPKKFDCKQVKKDKVEVWICCFQDAISFNEVLEEDSKKLLRLWLIDDASQWMLDIQSIADSESWDVSRWLEELKLKFGVKPSDKLGDIWKIAELRKDKELQWCDFNKEFKKYLNTIPSNLYTDEWVKQTYLKSIASVDKDIWWAVYKDNKGKILEVLIKEIEEISNEKEEGLRGVKDIEQDKKVGITKPESATTTSLTESKPETTGKEKSEIAELTDAFKNWVLLDQRKSTPQNPSNYRCYVCGKRGHYSKECPKSPFNERNERLKSESGANPGSSLLAIHSEIRECHADAMESIPNSAKRIRVDELINIPIRAVDPRQSRLGKPKKQAKKKPKPRTKMTEWPNRVLDSSAQISVRELLSLKPSLLNELLSCLRKSSFKESRSIFYAEKDQDKERSESLFTPSYILMRYGNQDLPILIDTGASYPLINQDILSKLGIQAIKMKNPLFIQLVSGKTIKLEEKCRMTLVMENDEVVLNFVIMENCAVSVLLGMDGCKSLKFRLYYDKNILSYKYNNSRGSVQLHSRETIYDELMDWESEHEGSDDSTDDEDSDDSQDEIVPLFYASLESEINGLGSPGPEELENSPEMEMSVPPQVSLVVERYSQLFKINEFTHPEIKDSVFDIIVPEDSSPPHCYLRRYL